MPEGELQLRTSEPEILPPATGEAGEAFQHLKTAARGLRSNLMTIAYYGFRVRLGEWFRDYGYEREDDYRESLDIPRSTWYRAVRIGAALHTLPLRDLMGIPVGNAELLIQVQPTLWQDYPWVEEAKTLRAADFAERVAARNRRSGIAVEPMVYVRFKVPFLAKRVIEESVETFRQKHELASVGQALEFIVADKYDMPNLLANLEAARQKVKEAVDSLRWRKISAQQETDWLYEAMKRLDAILRPLRNLDYESDGEEMPDEENAPCGDKDDQRRS